MPDRLKSFVLRGARRDVIGEMSVPLASLATTKVSELIELGSHPAAADGKSDGKEGGSDGKEGSKDGGGKEGSSDGKEGDSDGKEQSDPDGDMLARINDPAVNPMIAASLVGVRDAQGAALKQRLSQGKIF